MSKIDNIDASDCWYSEEDKILQITVSGTDITSWNVRWDLYNRDGIVVLSKTNPSSGITFTSAASGIAAVTIASTDFTASGLYSYKFYRTDAGSVSMLSTGSVTIL